ncbi:hypothetical protein CEXT_321211 [Caerostris extrusa]|uniref:Uncharacterized protein n=1 Tax=Caerostris extrusa TaxID=172846 RepID=A0AAV4PWN8_CAEEX|nr:hypothetical protein CEXT_321211 [Caerostris extrusa]
MTSHCMGELQGCLANRFTSSASYHSNLLTPLREKREIMAIPSDYQCCKQREGSLQDAPAVRSMHSRFILLFSQREILRGKSQTEP